MTSRRRRFAVTGALALGLAVLPAGTAIAQDFPPIPPIPPLEIGQQSGATGVQEIPVPGGSLVQGPAGQTFVPDGFVLVPSPDGSSQQVLPR